MNRRTSWTGANFCIDRDRWRDCRRSRSQRRRSSPAPPTKELLVAEPVHSAPAICRCTSRWPRIISPSPTSTVKIVTIETGAGHTNAVLSGQAFAFIGGPEHNAFAKAKGAELRAVVHCVDRGNVYFCAAKGLEPQGPGLGRPTSRARRIAVGPLRRHAELDHALSAEEVESRSPRSDVTLIETANSADPRRGQGQAGRRSAQRPSRSSRKASNNRSGASRSSMCRRSSAPTPTPPSTSASTPSRRSRRWCAASCAAW